MFFYPEEITVAWMFDVHGDFHFLGRVPDYCRESDISGVKYAGEDYSGSVYEYKELRGKIKIGSIAEYVNEIVQQAIDGKVYWMIDNAIDTAIERHRSNDH